MTTAEEMSAVPELWWSPSTGLMQRHRGEFHRARVGLDGVVERPAGAARLVREEDVDDLRLRLWQEHDEARAVGIPRGAITAAESVVSNILMNAPESTSLTRIAEAIVAEVAGALATLPGEPPPCRASGHMVRVITKGADNQDVYGPYLPCPVCGPPPHNHISSGVYAGCKACGTDWNTDPDGTTEETT